LDGEDIVSYVEVFDFEHSQRWRAREFRNRKAYELFGLRYLKFNNLKRYSRSYPPAIRLSNNIPVIKIKA
jgi:hypothetical protein